MTLQAYPVKLENGVVHSVDGSRLPERANAVLVILPEPVVDERGATIIRRPEFASLEAWQRPFDEFFTYADSHPSEADIEAVSDDELNALVHSARDAK